MLCSLTICKSEFTPKRKDQVFCQARCATLASLLKHYETTPLQVVVEKIPTTKPSGNEQSTHVCPPCSKSHVEDHKCPTHTPCSLPHLKDHVCSPCTRSHGQVQYKRPEQARDLLIQLIEQQHGPSVQLEQFKSALTEGMKKRGFLSVVEEE